MVSETAKPVIFVAHHVRPADLALLAADFFAPEHKHSIYRPRKEDTYV